MAGNVWDPGNPPPTSPPSSGTELGAARALTELAGMALRGAREDNEDDETADAHDAAAAGPSSSKKRNVGRPVSAEEKNEHEGSVNYCELKDVKLELGEAMEIEPKSEGTQSGTSCPSNRVSSLGCRSKQAISEEEKEAKRMRRILANRESARQTIRRRQALREELLKKVNDLSLDNKNIKMEKEQILQEYETLKSTNKQLKEQIAEVTRREIVSGQDLELTLASCSLSPAKIPAPSHGRPVCPAFGWPSWPPHFPPNLAQFYEKGGTSKGEHNPSTIPYHFPPYCALFYPQICLPVDDTSTSQKPNIKDDHVEGYEENKPNIKKEEKIVTVALSEGMGSTSGRVTPANQIAFTKSEKTIQDVGGNNPQELLQVTSGYRVHKSADAAAAAEARKRRIGLTRSKRIFGKHHLRHHT